ncbi:hypothetical protein PR048_020312 [Dryococelus australis]|uniref:WAP domain-containing protein n=1 Tax=Dryococelus australis TaxID=614101 RepID=A0ABQ9H5Z7_9NEOP|nr:hypothetical protein PR048_020312 [Dryococelus australis]
MLRSFWLAVVAVVVITFVVTAPVSGQNDGTCPEPPEDSVGICADLCTGDNDCSGSMKCCPNACNGHACTDISGMFSGVAVEQLVSPTDIIQQTLRPSFFFFSYTLQLLRKQLFSLKRVVDVSKILSSLQQQVAIQLVVDPK